MCVRACVRACVCVCVFSSYVCVKKGTVNDTIRVVFHGLYKSLTLSTVLVAV